MQLLYWSLFRHDIVKENVLKCILLHHFINQDIFYEVELKRPGRSPDGKQTQLLMDTNIERVANALSRYGFLGGEWRGKK